MKNPLVSVVMATFNEPVNYIAEAIESVLGQTFADFEFIIVDDSTNTDTIKKIDSYKDDKRITVIRGNSRFGFVEALNHGLKVARGEFIARMDADDISVPDRLEKQVKFFWKHPKIDVLGGNICIINEQGSILSIRKYPNNKLSLLISSIFRSPVAHPAAMFRRSIVENNLYYDKSFKKAEDTEFWFRLRNKGFKISNLPDEILLFRVSGNLAKKRNVEHFSYNFKARYKNFSWKYFYVDIPSIIITKLYVYIPEKLISLYYFKENNNNVK